MSEPKSSEEVAFDWETAPEYVRIALKAATTLLDGAGCTIFQSAKLAPRWAAMINVDVALWLRKMGYLSPVEGDAIARVMIAFHTAHNARDL